MKDLGENTFKYSPFLSLSLKKRHLNLICHKQRRSVAGKDRKPLIIYGFLHAQAAVKWCMFYHSNKAKGSSVKSNFTVSWSSFSSTSAVRKRDHLTVMHRSSTSPADEASRVITCRTCRNKRVELLESSSATEQKGVHRKRPSKQTGLKDVFSGSHLIILHVKRQKPLPCPEFHLPVYGQYREDFKKWPGVIVSSSLEAQVIHFTRAWYTEVSCLSFVIIRLLWDVASWKSKSSATFDNSGPFCGCLNESDFVCALHSLLERKTNNGRTVKQCCQTTAVETMSVWACKYKPGDRK